jgi:hypothetical protein
MGALIEARPEKLSLNQRIGIAVIALRNTPYTGKKRDIICDAADRLEAMIAAGDVEYRDINRDARVAQIADMLRPVYGVDRPNGLSVVVSAFVHYHPDALVARQALASTFYLCSGANDITAQCFNEVSKIVAW